VLQVYEERFKKGEINVLNCSTTMEMGIDIPNVAMVVNANLPPSISNYRQRVGRAGRRGEPWAFGLTFCRDLPLDRAAFEAPEQFLTAPIAAPAVRLDSAPIVMRHVNAALLAAFLRALGDFKLMGSAGAFFGAQDDPDAPFAASAPADGFLVELLGSLREDPEVERDLDRLTRGTILAGRPSAALCAEVANTFEDLMRRWRREYVELVGAAAAAAEKEVKQSFQLRAKRMAGEFLIGELARRGFTPAYGFPVDVVSFDHLSGRKDEPQQTVMRSATGAAAPRGRSTWPFESMRPVRRSCSMVSCMRARAFNRLGRRWPTPPASRIYRSSGSVSAVAPWAWAGARCRSVLGARPWVRL